MGNSQPNKETRSPGGDVWIPRLPRLPDYQDGWGQLAPQPIPIPIPVEDWPGQSRGYPPPNQ